MQVTYVVDRIERGENADFAVLIRDGSEQKTVIEYSLAVSLAGGDVKEGDVFSAKLSDGGKISSLTLLEKEKEEREKKAASRLSALFTRNKK